MTESDEDGDGRLETIVVSDSRDQSFEVFIRSEDGNVAPLDGRRLEEIREKERVADALLQESLKGAFAEDAESDEH